MKKLTFEQRERLLRTAARRASREKIRKIKRKAKRLRREIALNDRRGFAMLHGVPLDTDLARTQIVMPEVFSLKDNYHETVKLVDLMRESVLMERRPVMLHLTALKTIDPPAALMLVAEIFRIRNLTSRAAVTGTYPKSRAIYDFLAEMGFFQLLNVREAFGPPKDTGDPSRDLYLKFITGNRVVSETVDAFVSVVEKRLIPLNTVARGKLVGAIIEAMNNTLDHAHPEPNEGQTMTRRWWLSARVNVVNREVTIMIFDQGVGIPNTLDTTLYDRIRAALSGIKRFDGLTASPTDGEKILAATELHRTGTGQSGRGKGFRNMKQFVDTCADGELQVLSNRGRYSYMAGTEEYANEARSIGGTLIEWRFRQDGSVEMYDE